MDAQSQSQDTQATSDKFNEDQYVSRTISAEDEAQHNASEETTNNESENNINKSMESTEPAEKTETPNEIQQLKQQMDQLAKQFAAAQSFIGKQSTLIGDLRKAIKEKQEPVDPKKFLNDFVENPAKALEDEMNRREQAKAEEAEAQTSSYQTNLNMIMQTVPNIDALIPSMMEELAADGVENPSIEMIKASIQSEPHLVMNYAKRAAYKVQLANTEQKGKQLIERVATGSKKTPATQGKSQIAEKQRSISPRDLRNMSDEELNKLYAQMTKK